MIELNNKNLTIFLIAFVVVLAVLVIVTQAADQNQTFDDEALKEQVESLDSFANEETVLIDQFTQSLIAENYFVGQTQHIADKVLSFYDEVSSSAIPEEQQPKIQALEKIVFKFAMSLKTIESQSSDAENLHKQQQAIKDLQNQLKSLPEVSQ